MTSKIGISVQLTPKSFDLLHDMHEVQTANLSYSLTFRAFDFHMSFRLSFHVHFYPNPFLFQHIKQDRDKKLHATMYLRPGKNRLIKIIGNINVGHIGNSTKLTLWSGTGWLNEIGRWI